MKVNNKEYLRMWAEQGALVTLTDRDDTRVERAPVTFGVDFLVSLREGDTPTGKYLGILYGGSEHSARTPIGKRHLQKAFEKGLESARYASLPVCLFFFTVEGSESYWRWLRQPVIEDGVCALQTTTDSALQPLTRDTWAGILETVRQWYERQK